MLFYNSNDYALFYDAIKNLNNKSVKYNILGKDKDPVIVCSECSNCVHEQRQGSKEALKTIGALAGAQAGGKAAGLYEEVAEGDRQGGYIGLIARGASQRVAEQFGATIGKDQKMTNESAEAMYESFKTQGNFEQAALDKVFKDANGNFLDGNALMGSISQNQQGQVNRLNIDGVSASAWLSGDNTRISSVDSSFINNSGHSYEGQMSGTINKKLSESFGAETAETASRTVGWVSDIFDVASSAFATKRMVKEAYKTFKK